MYVLFEFLLICLVFYVLYGWIESQMRYLLTLISSSWLVFRAVSLCSLYSSEDNCSKYSFRSICSKWREPKVHLVFKKADHSRNRVYWQRTKLDAIFYTSDCDERHTVEALEKRFAFTQPARTTDFFTECLFVSFFLGEDERLAMILNEDRVVDFNKEVNAVDYQIRLYFMYGDLIRKDPEFSKFFNLPKTEKIPDVFMVVRWENRAEAYVIVIKNREPNANTSVEAKYINFFSKKKPGSVISLSTGVSRQSMAVKSWAVKTIPQQLPPVFAQLFGDVKRNEFQQECREIQAKYEFDRLYWVNNFHRRRIEKFEHANRGLSLLRWN